LADSLPLVLDPSINPLEPVLRSNYWLTIHVLTITLSYAAFALSLCLGNVVMGYYVFRPTQTAQIQNYSLYMYRAMQIGVVLLAAGTILGGVWADYSWGRFWGWDPKEVWALIALLLYLAVLHGRFTGWLKGFGFAATTIVSFLGVLMAWYGVNFVLGVGLHSYGFGSGGMGWVMGYVCLQVAFIVMGYINYQKAKSSQPLDNSIFPKD
jgi:ABC-type transport system involved in cytochrome c biogenesis permease subunit